MIAGRELGQRKLWKKTFLKNRNNFWIGCIRYKIIKIQKGKQWKVSFPHLSPSHSVSLPHSNVSILFWILLEIFCVCTSKYTCILPLSLLLNKFTNDSSFYTLFLSLAFLFLNVSWRLFHLGIQKGLPLTLLVVTLCCYTIIYLFNPLVIPFDEYLDVFQSFAITKLQWIILYISLFTCVAIYL